MFVDTRLAGKPRWYLSPPKDYNMRVPDAMLDCVVFVGLRKEREGNRVEDVPVGTAFMIGYPIGEGIRGQYVYLVTARHVAREFHGKDFFIRANTSDGISEDIWIDHRDPAIRWRFHPTEGAVDVAVLDIKLPDDRFGHTFVQSTMFLTDDVIQEAGIGIGDEVFVVGLFGVLRNATKNLPIVRVGNIAMMPSEPIPTSLGKTDAYLIEARSIGGLSGSPAFVWKEVLEEPDAKPERGIAIPKIVDRIYLLGLMHAHWDIPVEDLNDAVFRVEKYEWNVGIAIVTPARKIMEVLDQPELKEPRDAALAEARKAELPTMDSAIPDEPEHKTPAKPVSLYPMSEEEALQRLLRVPPPEKDGRERKVQRDN